MAPKMRFSQVKKTEKELSDGGQNFNYGTVRYRRPSSYGKYLRQRCWLKHWTEIEETTSSGVEVCSSSQKLITTLMTIFINNNNKQNHSIYTSHATHLHPLHRTSHIEHIPHLTSHHISLDSILTIKRSKQILILRCLCFLCHK